METYKISASLSQQTIFRNCRKQWLIVFCARCARCASCAFGCVGAQYMRKIYASFSPNAQCIRKICARFSPNAQHVRKICARLYLFPIAQYMRKICARFAQDCTYFPNAQYMRKICARLYLFLQCAMYAQDLRKIVLLSPMCKDCRHYWKKYVTYHISALNLEWYSLHSYF